MARHDRQEPLETLASTLNDLVRESVRENLARERRNVDPGGLALEDVAERLEIRVPPADNRVAELERGDVRLQEVREQGNRRDVLAGTAAGQQRAERGRARQSVGGERAYRTDLAHDLVVGVHLPTES